MLSFISLFVSPTQIGMQVVKSGYRTGITYGMVTAVEGIARLSYAGLDRVIKHVLTIEPQNSFEQVSGPGDSGSIWLEENSLSAIGLHFAGSDSPERALAMDLQPVLEALRVDLIRAPGLRPAITTTRQAERVAVPK